MEQELFWQQSESRRLEFKESWPGGTGIAQTAVAFAIFDDMLEITSPGPLPDNLPPAALGTGRSEIRNRILAPVFKDLKLIEAWGTGLQKIRCEVEKYPEIELDIKEIDNAF